MRRVLRPLHKVNTVMPQLQRVAGCLGEHIYVVKVVDTDIGT